VAGNHALHAWETYRANHPTVDVRCADLSQVVPVGMAVTPNISRDLGAVVTEFISGQDIDPFGLAA
jgi:hypothetical protein